ncbi:hypothetical protein E1B28_000037 [Marasmius oreades]|uniref:Glycosyltransferase family 1 protein n=1 Tax=Marasmius oreades TaxID=181124 RepID=A0A9P7V0I6_9AGAR|nr:uncharacterized protein E1B28_000037 [Marasmius oreades]KAG7098063.1 hypothetical protein E1B28_000037 [Marasmius oreades]
MMNELGKLHRGRLKAVEERINVLNVIPDRDRNHQCNDPLPSKKPGIEVISSFEKLLKQSGEITCLTSQRTIDCSKFPSPCVAIVDLFSNYVLDGIRSMATPEELPIVAWAPGSAGSTLMFWGPEEYRDGGGGGIENGKAQIEAFDSSESLFGQTADKVLRIPGYPPMYDYERKPQEYTGTVSSALVKVGMKSLMASDGVITVSFPVIEKEGIEACDRYFGSLGKSHFSVGPLELMPDVTEGRDAVTDGVLLFLDKMEGEFGEKSVIFISFGTLFWPTNTSVFDAIIDELKTTKTPFIVAHPSPVARTSKGLLDKIRACPYGLELAWAPQKRILSHPATGWFLTHGGSNSVQEALTFKVPMILWPANDDQPLHASLLSIQFKAAFELIEVRSGIYGKKIPYRYRHSDGPTPKFTVESAKKEFGQVLKDLRGTMGLVVRKNFEELATRVGRVWDEDGIARKGLEAFLKEYVDTGRKSFTCRSYFEIARL